MRKGGKRKVREIEELQFAEIKLITIVRFLTYIFKI